MQKLWKINNFWCITIKRKLCLTSGGKFHQNVISHYNQKLMNRLKLERIYAGMWFGLAASLLALPWTLLHLSAVYQPTSQEILFLIVSEGIAPLVSAIIVGGILGRSLLRQVPPRHTFFRGIVIAILAAVMSVMIAFVACLLLSVHYRAFSGVVVNFSFGAVVYLPFAGSASTLLLKAAPRIRERITRKTA